MNCTWVDPIDKQCTRVATNPHVARDGKEWANLCDAHHAEFEKCSDESARGGGNIGAMLRSWVRASGGAKKMAETIYRDGTYDTDRRNDRMVDSPMKIPAQEKIAELERRIMELERKGNRVDAVSRQSITVNKDGLFGDVFQTFDKTMKKIFGTRS